MRLLVLENYQILRKQTLKQFGSTIRGVHVGHNWDETDFEH